MKVCGVAVAMPQGYSWAPNSSIGSCVNVGTIRGVPRLPAGQRGTGRVGALPTDGRGVGRSRRSSPSAGKPVTWAKLRRLTRRWITLTEGRGSEGGPLGHLPYLDAKARGDNSMAGKRGAL